MSLYDEEDLGAPPTEVAVGWSTGAKLMQSQLQAKKVAASLSKQAPPSMGPPKNMTPNFMPNKQRTFSTPTLAPVIDLKSKKPLMESERRTPKSDKISSARTISSGQIGLQAFNEPNFQVDNEYDPLWPNDYHKVIQEMRGDKKTEEEIDTPESKKRRYTEEGRAKARERFARGGEGTPGPPAAPMDPQLTPQTPEIPSGFGRRPRGGEDDYSDEDEDIEQRGRHRKNQRLSGSTSGGAAIAPPPSLTETTNPEASGATNENNSPVFMGASPSMPGLGVAAKIMAKYGYKQGQGLGRSEQGIAQALAVEKTSRRGGRIVHEKDLMPPPMFGESFKTLNKSEESTPPRIEDTDEYGDPIVNPQDVDTSDSSNKPSITELMKNPSKVVLCQNMVGPGEVDDELEPEIKEECNTKYGDVQSVVIFEIPNTTPEESVRIFVEFKRVESAIKAVVDLNGRFFGGREVRASFYNVEKFKNLNLNE